jgi:4-amino-4-deoxy-L-arabinose transferase-like glycosyltransferase
MYGGTAPLAALFMWCFSPTVIAYASTIMPDLGAAACGAAAIVYFRRWLIKAMWRYALVTGILLGVAALTKTTWLILFGVLPSLWPVP